MPCASTGVCVELVKGDFPCWRVAAAAAKVSASRRGMREALSLPVEEAEEWLRVIVLRGFTSVLEHCVYTFEAVCSRVCSHQLVRHRIASYTQQSMRWSEGFLREAALEACKLLGRECPERPRSRGDYDRYAWTLLEAMEVLGPREALEVASRAYVIPPSVLKRDEETIETYAKTLIAATAAYYRLLSLGVPREDARFAIPHSVKTRIVFTMNARELLESFLPLRLCTRAQWEIRTLAWLVLGILRSREPILWRYAGPRCLRVAQLAGAHCTLDELIEDRCTLPLETCPEGVPADRIPGCVRAAMNSLQA